MREHVLNVRELARQADCFRIRAGERQIRIREAHDRASWPLTAAILLAVLVLYLWLVSL